MPELYAVRWADAHGSSGTLATHEIEHKPYEYTTVGFLVLTNHVGVSIAFEQGEDGRWRDVSFIPREIVLDEYSLGDLKQCRTRGQRKKNVKKLGNITSGLGTENPSKAGMPDAGSKESPMPSTIVK